MLFSGPVFENTLHHCRSPKLTLQFVVGSQAMNNRGGKQEATEPLYLHLQKKVMVPLLFTKYQQAKGNELN